VPDAFPAGPIAGGCFRPPVAIRRSMVLDRDADHGVPWLPVTPMIRPVSMASSGDRNGLRSTRAVDGYLRRREKGFIEAACSPHRTAKAIRLRDVRNGASARFLMP